MALERGLKGRDQLLKLVQGQAREIQERHRAGLQLGKPYTSHGSCLLLLYRDVRGTSYQKESGINSLVEMGRPNSYRLTNSPITRSCMRSVLEKHSVRRMSRLSRVRRLRCLLSIFCVCSLPT